MEINSNWDSVVLTVGTTEQKKLCEGLLALGGKNIYPEITVISDDEAGCRIGSGGAVINAMKTLGAEGKKILIINSGGFSKRSINYSIKGKAFANLIYDGEETNLLRLILKKSQPLCEKITSGVLICCSDILVDTDDIETELDKNIGFCNRADISTGTRHGVMFKDCSGALSHYLHKRTSAELEAMGEESVLVDTGTIFLCDDTVRLICKTESDHNILDRLKSNRIEFNLYPEIISLLSRNIDAERYFSEDAQNEEHIKIRHILFDALKNTSLTVYEISEKSFIHFGTLSESSDNIIRLSGRKNVVINSFFNNCDIGSGAVIENSVLDGKCSVGSRSSVSDIFLKNAVIPDDTAVCGIKLSDGSYVTVCCPLNENPKNDGLWEQKRFYKGKTFTDSFLKFIERESSPDVSLADCIEYADFGYPLKWLETLHGFNYCKPCAEYLSKRDAVLSEYFSRLSELKELECVCEKAEINLPVRVNLSGTWTDAMPYCTDNGGEVINVAVTADGELPIKVTAEKLFEPVIEFNSDGRSTVISLDEINDPRYENDFDDFILHRAVLRVMGIGSETKLKNGFRLSTNVSGIMHGSGLGTSSILLSGCFKALSELFGKETSREETVEKVFIAELVMKTGGGWQDQVGGIYPGVKIACSERGIIQKVNVKQLEIGEEMKAQLNSMLVIVSTGQRHFGRFIVTDVMNRYISGEPQALEAFDELKRLNKAVIESLKKSDIRLLSDCLNTQMSLLKRLSDKICDSEIEKIISVCKKIADGICICGAGAGGYLLLILKENIDDKALGDFIKNSVFENFRNPIKKLEIYEKACD